MVLLALDKRRWLVWFDRYDYVLVYGNDPLKQKVLKREVNLFKCNKCGFKQELAVPFYYMDPLHEIDFLVSPEHTTIFGSEPGISLDKYARHLEIFGEVQEIVFGYDELFERLRPYED